MDSLKTSAAKILFSRYSHFFMFNPHRSFPSMLYQDGISTSMCTEHWEQKLRPNQMGGCGYWSDKLQDQHRHRPGFPPDVNYCPWMLFHVNVPQPLIHRYRVICTARCVEIHGKRMGIKHNVGVFTGSGSGVLSPGSFCFPGFEGYPAGWSGWFHRPGAAKPPVHG